VAGPSSFLGTFRYALDDKGRINVPAKFRKALPKKARGTFIVVRGLEGCLFLYPLSNWAAVEEKLANLPGNKKATRLYVRSLLRDATEVTCDAQGRIPLTEPQRNHAGIASNVLIAGTLDRIEVWDPARYDLYFENSGVTYEDVAEDILLDPRPEIHILKRE
jgi:MraZ protein